MGKVFVCLACGKRSHDEYGDNPIDYGWDVSCAINSQEFDEDRLVIKNDRVVRIKAAGEEEEEK